MDETEQSSKHKYTLFTTAMKANKTIYYTTDKPIQSNSVILYTNKIFLHSLYTFLVTLLCASCTQTDAIAPTIDYSHNMRILKLPKSRCQVGDLIYRLKGSDGDPNSQLIFGVSGIEARALLDIVPVPKSWNEADVFLKSPLTESSYNLTIYVSDGNKTTQVQSTILAMDEHDDDHSIQQKPIKNNSDTNSGNEHNLPFLNTKHVFNVPENTEPNEPIGIINVLESQTSDLPVRFELRGHGADKFQIRYVFGPKGQSRGELALAQKVDYERQNLYRLKVLALNAWTNSKMDTRNVATMDLVITIGDRQDSPPIFRRLPQWLRLANTMRPGDLVAKVEAEDGDYADQRPINYALDANSPLINYFDIDKLTGEIRLTKPISELAMHAAWDSTISPMLSVFASEQPDTSSYDHLWPPMYARAELPLMLIDMVNEPPQFIGGWQTTGAQKEQIRILHGYLVEMSDEQQSQASNTQYINWYTNVSTSNDLDYTNSSPVIVENLSKLMNGRPFVLDLGQGSNGTFELLLDGRDAHLFQVEPSIPVSKQSVFSVSLATGVNKTLFDYDQQHDQRFIFDIIARDFGLPQRQSSRIRCLIELIDLNDNAPQFDTDLYSFTIYENAQLGQIIGSVRAKDMDSNGRVKYTRLIGQESNLFRLNEESGIITLDGYLDRERRSYYLFQVEAKDSTGTIGARANYSQIMINVLDVNDNAPIFLQSHYDAVLMADGTFHQPLVVRAIDADEPETANSQVAYEIVAGNQNDQFSIDTVSGVIYPRASGRPSLESSGDRNSLQIPKIPPILKEPILPYQKPGQQYNKPMEPDPAGKISSNQVGHEVEETTVPSQRRQPSSTIGSLTEYIGSKLGWPRSSADNDGEDQSIAVTQNRTGDLTHSYTNTITASTTPPRQRAGKLEILPPMDLEQLPALDLLLSLESEQQYNLAQARDLSIRSTTTAAATSGFGGLDAMKFPPVTQLIVRAHDFGIPLRSSSVKVNIYNQALQSRSISMILNGTAEQLEARRDAIERAFSSLTGSKASIESIDALSDSSSLSVAKIKLASPQHSLVDLTDLSALMNAIDYHGPHDSTNPNQFRYPIPTHYISGDRLIPAGMSSNITSGFFPNDINGFAIDANNLERRLLVYIIIVGVCILALLVIWMIFMCSREGDHVKLIDKKTNTIRRDQIGRDSFRSSGGNYTADSLHKTYAKTTADAATNGNMGSAIGNNLAKPRGTASGLDPGLRLHHIGSSASHLNELLLPPVATTTMMKQDHGSMYNGQIWFEPSHRFGSGRMILSERRASSAPSGGSLDSALHSAIAGSTRAQNRALSGRNASGQFFPNTIGYMENLAAIGDNYIGAQQKYVGQPQQQQLAVEGGSVRLGKRNWRRKVAPMDATEDVKNQTAVKQAPKKPARFNMRETGHENEAFEADLESGQAVDSKRHRNKKRGDGSLSSCSALSASTEGDVNSTEIVLDSDQELLGFDSTGTPIIATHTRTAAHIKPLIVEMVEPRTVSPHPRGTRRPPIDTSNKQPTKAQASEKSEIKPAEAATKSGPASGVEKAPDTTVKAQTVPPKSDPEAAKKEPITRPSENGASKSTPPTNGLMGELSEKLAQRKQSVEKSEEAAGDKATAGASVPNQLSSSKIDSAKTKTISRQAKLERRPVQSAGSLSQSSSSSTAESTATVATCTTGSIAAPSGSGPKLKDMRNAELLEKQSIFALTYSGIATDKLPGC